MSLALGRNDVAQISNIADFQSAAPRISHASNFLQAVQAGSPAVQQMEICATLNGYIPKGLCPPAASCGQRAALALLLRTQSRRAPKNSPPVVIKYPPGQRDGVNSNVDKLFRRGTSFTVARKLRIQYPGAIYHIINRGDRNGGCLF